MGSDKITAGLENNELYGRAKHLAERFDSTFDIIEEFEYGREDDETVALAIRILGRGGNSNMHGYTDLHHAASLAMIYTCKALIDNGANVHREESMGHWDGQTPYHKAAMAKIPDSDYGDVLKLLLLYGADPVCSSIKFECKPIRVCSEAKELERLYISKDEANEDIWDSLDPDYSFRDKWGPKN